METPRHWRMRKERYALEGRVCPVCGAKIFPPTRPVCPVCGGGMNEKFAAKTEALGVGALLFVKGEDGKLKMLLFEDVNDGHEDRDSSKRERLLVQGDVFSQPEGLNTVTGKVDDPEAFALYKTGEMSSTLKSILVESLLREITEEAVGLAELTSADIHYFSQSTIQAEQIRANESDQQVLVKFTVFVLAILLNQKDVSGLERDYQLFDLTALKQLNPGEVRKATLATFDFIATALLFLAQEGQLEERLMAVLNQKQQDLADVLK